MFVVSGGELGFLSLGEGGWIGFRCCGRNGDPLIGLGSGIPCWEIGVAVLVGGGFGRRGEWEGGYAFVGVEGEGEKAVGEGGKVVLGL